MKKVETKPFVGNKKPILAVKIPITNLKISFLTLFVSSCFSTSINSTSGSIFFTNFSTSSLLKESVLYFNFNVLKSKILIDIL